MKSRTHSFFSICTLFVILWGLYGFHWYDCAKGTLLDSLSNVFLGINILVCLYCVFNLQGKRLPSFFAGVNILLFTFFIYGGLYIVGGDSHFHNGEAINRGSYLIGILRSYLPIYAFYFFARKGYINLKNITIYLIILVAFSLLYNIYVTIFWVSIGYDSGFTNNLGYLFISFFPFVFLYKDKSIFQYILLALILGLTLSSMKRGAILIAIILLFWFIHINTSHVKMSKRIKIFFLSFVIVSIGAFYLNDLYESSIFFQRRIELTAEGNSSGRDVLYTRLLNYYWYDASWYQQLFGLGPDSSFDIIGKEAHNDWLEILTSQGLFGVIVYLFFWINSYIYWKRIPKNRVYYPIVGSYLIIMFMRTFFSMSYAAVPTAATLILGYSIAMNEMQNKLNRSEKIY